VDVEEEPRRVQPLRPPHRRDLFCTEPVTRFCREAIYQQAADVDQRYPERCRHMT